MTRLLVSVRGVWEARRASEGGADLVDIKEPSRGSLGATSMLVIQAIVQEFAGQVPVSAACGELLDARFAFEKLPRELAFAKLGLQGCAAVPDWRKRLRAAWNRIPPTIGRVGVAYADWKTCAAPPPHQVIRAAIDEGCRYVLIDTFDKRHHDLFSVVSTPAIDSWMRLAREGGLGTVIAGSLSASTLPRALRLRPDFVAVRGAACDGERTTSICTRRVKQLRAILAEPSQNMRLL